MAGGNWRDTVIGGAVAGGVCAAVGIAVSASLRDEPWSLLLIGMTGSIVTGVIGAAIGKLLH